MKKYELIARSKSTCPMKATAFSLADKLAPGEHIPAKFVIGPKEEGKFTLYLDSVNEENLVAFVNRISEGADPLPDEEIETCVKNGNYTVLITGRNGNFLNGEFQVEENTSGVSAGKYVVSEKLAALMKEKAENGIRSMEDSEDAVREMFDADYPESVIEKVVRSYTKKETGPTKPKCVWRNPYREEEKKMGIESLQCEISRCILDRYGVMLQGPKSVGKDTLVDDLAWKHGRHLERIVFHRQMTMMDVFGGKTTDNSASDALRSEEVVKLAMAYVLVHCDPNKASIDDFKAASQFEVLKARAASTSIISEVSGFVDAIVKGYMLCIDEVNLGEQNMVTALLNPLLDKTGYYTLPGKGAVPIHPDFVLICTQNEDYLGTEEQNEATMSRLCFFNLKQPKDVSELLETSVAAELKRNGFDISVPKNMIKQANKFYKNLLNAWEDGTITSSALNIRGFTRAIAVAAESDGHSKLWRQLQIHVVNGCPSTERGVVGELLKTHVTI